MTIDEAINMFIDMSNTQKAMAVLREDEYSKVVLEESASHFAQVAEWLKELKAYKEELPKEIKNAKVRQAEALEANVKNENYNSHLAEYIKGYLCGLSYTEGIIAKILEDVKVVEDGSDTK